jgi:hypothetical protein
LQADTPPAVRADEEVAGDRFVAFSRYFLATIRARADVTLLTVGALGDEPGGKPAPRAHETHFPKILHRDAVLKAILPQHSSDLARELCREVEIRISIGVTARLVGRIVGIDLDGRVCPQITPQFGDLLEAVGGIVPTVTDGQPDASEREVDLVVQDLLRASAESITDSLRALVVPFGQ